MRWWKEEKIPERMLTKEKFLPKEEKSLKKRAQKIKRKEDSIDNRFICLFSIDNQTL